MADIKNYLEEKEKREQAQLGYKEKIARHKMATFYKVLLMLAVLLILIIIVLVQYKRHVYTNYETIATVSREMISGITDTRIGNAVLSYSKDGAHCTDAMGNVRWNQTFEIQDVKLDINGDTVAIGDYNGRSIYVANSEKLLGEITTNMPIRDIAVSQKGYVTAVLADTDVTWINTYNNNGELLFYSQAHMDESGYPVDISLSPNGELLCVSYVYVDAGVLKTNIGFFNFGPVGAERNDYLVSGFNYTDMLIPYVRFMNDTTAFAVGDSRLMIFTGAHIPVTQEEHVLDREIQAVYYSDKYIGLVFMSDNNENRYQLNVYEPATSKKRIFYFDMDYTDVFFGKDYFVIYNETSCQIVTMDGIVKFSGDFTQNVRLMLPAGNTYKYLLITDDSIDTIQLR
ncbi:MAG: hypothetical protein HFH82_06315 [Lachnospiraceae bacterium]|nr:hypothetical protein [Lachnospiraceae bacterium]